MARRLFNYEQKSKKRYDEVDHRGFTTGEERMSSSAHRRICTDYGVSCATVMQCVYRHVDKEKKAEIDEMLRSYAKQAPKLTGNSIGILNVQKRIKLLCGREYGISYTENEAGGVTAHILLPLKEETK